MVYFLNGNAMTAVNTVRIKCIKSGVQAEIYIFAAVRAARGKLKIYSSLNRQRHLKFTN